MAGKEGCDDVAVDDQDLAVGESDSVTGPALAVEHTHHAEEVYGTLKAVRNLSAV
jgi:hypothetical protein